MAQPFIDKSDSLLLLKNDSAIYMVMDTNNIASVCAQEVAEIEYRLIRKDLLPVCVTHMKTFPMSQVDCDMRLVATLSIKRHFFIHK